MKAVQNQNQETRTKRRVSNRGSAMLLAVGLLTIIAMLGTTFLLISRMDRQRSEAIIAKAAVGPLAEGVIRTVSRQLMDDFYTGTTIPTPYPGPLTALELLQLKQQWQRFIDAPSYRIPHPTDPFPATLSVPIDDWLASSATYLTDPADPTTETWLHMTALSTSINPVSHNDRLLTGATGIDTNNSYVDTDGSGTKNAVLYNSQATNNRGERYFISARITDLSGKINSNIACGTDATLGTLPSYNAAAEINLYGLFGGIDGSVSVAYNSLNSARCGGQTALIDITPEKVNTNIALKLLSPGTNYTPFAIGDEMYLRWLGADNGRTETGRLFNSGAIAAGLRKSLTTYNVTRSRLRTSSGTRLNLADITLLDDDANKQTLYEQLLSAAHPVTAAGVSSAAQDDKLELAHFIANLWAYISPVNQNRAFAFTPNQMGVDPDAPEAFTVYGVIEQPVISEAYAYSLAQDYDGLGTGLGNNGYAYAIELYNPTNISITLTYDATTQHGYRLKQGSNTFDFPTQPDGTDIILAAGERIVIYNYGGSMLTRVSYPYGVIQAPAGVIRTPVTADGFNFTDEGATFNGWLKWNTLNLTQGDVELQRAVKEGTDAQVFIQLDKVLGDDIGYDVNDRATNDKATTPVGNTDQKYNLGRRDDDTARKRVIVPEFYKPPLTDATFAVHTLYASNALDATAVTALDTLPDQVYRGFPLELAHGAPVNIGDLSSLYLYGPEASNPEGLPQALTTVKASIDRGRPNYLGGVNSEAVAYPDVPWATLLGELLERIPTDSTRSDDTTRIYGKININTATKEVLERLPWPVYLDLDGDGTRAVDNSEDIIPSDIADYIIAYRDMLATLAPVDYSTRSVGRVVSEFKGFVTPGEIAIPLAAYADSFLADGTVTVADSDARYLELRDSLFNAVSNLLSVNSDTFVVNIAIELRKPDATTVKQRWYYLAVIDRSNCQDANDTPAVLLFTQIK